MMSLKFPSFSDASIANFEQVFVSWCFTISVTVIKKLNCKKHSLICNNVTAQKIKFSIKDFFSKCDQIGRLLRLWSCLLKKFLTENFIFCPVCQHTFQYLGKKTFPYSSLPPLKVYSLPVKDISTIFCNLFICFC